MYLVHFAQMTISNQFQMYNYSTEKENLQHYNQSVAPFYSLENIKIPVALYWAHNDWLGI